MITPLAVTTSDSVSLEAQLAMPDAPWAAAALAHPHPQYGGNMHNNVIAALFDALPAAGVAAARFNFRGVDASGGAFDNGRGERLDVVAALDALATAAAGLPLVVAAYSFGAAVSLGIADPRLAGWVGIAPPIRGAGGLEAATDPRPKLLIVPEHDQYCDPDDAGAATAGWANTQIEVVAGADHFFAGRTDRAVELSLGFLRNQFREPAEEDRAR